MKKNSKNLIYLLLVCIFVAMTCTACSATTQEETTSSRRDKSDNSKEDKEKKSKNDTDEAKSDSEENVDLENEDNNNSEPAADYYEGTVGGSDETYFASLQLLDDSQCIYEEKYNYISESYRLYHYDATYTDMGDYIMVTYKEPSYEDEGEYEQKIKVYIDGDTIIDAQYVYGSDEEIEKIAGTYKCKLESGEPAVLEITDANNIVLSIDGIPYETYLYNDDKYGWVLSAYDNFGDFYIRWVVYFSGNRFAYDEYNVIEYQNIAGSYVIDGELGRLIMDIDDYGCASVKVSIANKEYEFYGDVYLDEDVIMSADLSSYVGDDKQYNISLSFMTASPEEENDYWYEGTLQYVETTILNAG